jgi:hypothetical protein
VLPKKEVVFKDLLPTAAGDDGDGSAATKPGQSTVARVYEQTSFARCAVVGNGGILKTAKYGRAIDSHTAVFRANQAPVKSYEAHVGTKATFRILNKKWTQQYSRGDKMWLPLERGATLVASRGDPAVARRLVVAYPKRPDVAIVGLDSSVRGAVSKLMNEFRVALRACANVRPPGGQTPSSGIIMTVMALAMCREINLYGFGNGHGAAGAYQYYVLRGTERRAGDQLHSMQLEHHLIKRLEATGHLKVCESGQASCGFRAAGGRRAAGLNGRPGGGGGGGAAAVAEAAAAAAQRDEIAGESDAGGEAEAFRTVAPQEFAAHSGPEAADADAHPEDEAEVDAAEATWSPQPVELAESSAGEDASHEVDPEPEPEPEVEVGEGGDEDSSKVQLTIMSDSTDR